MDADEREIYYFLKQYRNEFVTAKEICRRAGGKRRFREDESWALQPLQRMLERKILEEDNNNAYRLRPPRDTKDKLQRWVSPHITRVLRESGKDFGHIIEIPEDELDKYYESL